MEITEVNRNRPRRYFYPSYLIDKHNRWRQAAKVGGLPLDKVSLGRHEFLPAQHQINPRKK
jgi:hypothetical protein